MAIVEGRIGSLARTHDLLSKSSWIGADLGNIVDDELRPYRTGENTKIAASGPTVTLPPATAQILALTVHELATNAAKYGALSSASGRVSLTWELQNANLVLKWIESPGLAIRPPTRQGYGIKMISASIERQLGGRATFDWTAEGLRCTLTVPFDSKKAATRRGQVGGGARDQAGGLKSQGSEFDRVLLVEDEALVGLMMKSMLTELGYFVVGPYARLTDAISAARDGKLDAAILDVNIGGEWVYPIAEILADRNVPFAFVTGYGAQSIDQRFAQIPVVQKPISRDGLQNVLAKRPSQSRRVTELG